MKSNPQLPREHAGSRYQCVTVRVIEALQRAYQAGADLGQAVPDIDADTAAVIVAETLEADRVWNLPPERFLHGGAAKGPMSDFKRAALAEIAFLVADTARDHKDKEEQGKWWAVAMASLSEIAKSPTASPLLWYQDIYQELAYARQRDPNRESIRWVKCSLAHDLRYYEGRNALSLLQDLAEMHIAVGDLDKGLMMLTILLRNVPDDIWIYNLMAISFDRHGLTEIGAQATRRGLELIDAQGDPEKLRGQLQACLERCRRASVAGERPRSSRRCWKICARRWRLISRAGGHVIWMPCAASWRQTWTAYPSSVR